MEAIAPNPTDTRKDTRKRPTLADKLRARILYIQGEGTAEQVARALNLRVSTVRTWCFDEKWTAKRRDYIARETAKITDPLPAPPIPPIISTADNQSQALSLSKQMDSILQQMEGTTNPDKLAKLATAYDKLFGRWQVLTGTPNPGSRKQRKERNTPQSFPTPEPEPVQPVQPAQVTPAPEPAPEPAPAPIVSDTPQYVVVPDAPSGA